MPSLEDQRQGWARHHWRGRGEGWSKLWGGSVYEWWGTIYPRVREFVPAGTVLEIGMGYGRWTRFLLHACDQLIGVDLVEKCVRSCRERFAEYPRAAFHQNDGLSLEMVPDRSVDLVFSFDSLVHVDRPVIEAYLQQLATKLAPDGVGFLHHSNLAAYVDPDTGALPYENPNQRDPSVDADVFAGACADSGLLCIGQELVNWEVAHLNDCFSLITLPGSRFERPHTRVENPGFMDEAAALEAVAAHYGGASFPRIGRRRAPEVEPTAPSRLLGEPAV
jgi:SAM-dependent methyltransferase